MTHIQGLSTESMATENRAAEGMMNERLQEGLAENLGVGLAPALISDDPADVATAVETTTIVTAATTVASGTATRPLSMHIKNMLEDYFRELDGHPPADLYQMVLAEVEQPLLESVLHYTRGNQSKAAAMLGLNRGTLRKKLKQYDIN